MGGKLWLFLLLGCCLLAGCQQTETVSVPPAVGCYPVEGYAPDPADLAAAPYTYTGGAQGISVTCTVRQAEPAAFSALLQEKAALCAQLAQNKRANPDPSYQQGRKFGSGWPDDEIKYLHEDYSTSFSNSSTEIP